MRLTKDSPHNSTRVMLFGLPGSGKSTLAAELSRTHNLIWLSIDNDRDVLLKLPDEQLERINFIDIPDSATFPVACQTLLQLFKNQRGKICHSHGMFSCALCTKNKAEFSEVDFTKFGPSDICVLDTGSQLGRSILAHVTKDQAVEYKPERDDWGSLRKFTEFFASQFQGFRGNLIVIFHAIEHAVMQGDKVISTKLIPDFGSKGMALTIAKNFSHVIYMEVKNKKHRAYSSSTYSNDCLTKSRTDFRIEDLPEPDLSPLFPLIVSAAEPEPEIQVGPPTASVINQTQTPAQNAVTGLSALQQRMKEKGLTK